MFHDWLVLWFESVRDWGYTGVATLMAVESTILPIPSEVIVPPAAYWAAQGEMSFWGVVLAGAVGSTGGSALMYGFAVSVGRPFVLRWGKYFLLPPHELATAEAWLADFALMGIFLARLLPVLRHLIGFAAGIVRVPFVPFCLTTFAGSFLWCSVLAWVGAATIGKHPDLLQDPDRLAQVLKDDLFWFVALVAAVGAGWLLVKVYARRRKPLASVDTPPGAR
jgi:membrane protein DedA with SNARE-associated domain